MRRAATDPVDGYLTVEMAKRRIPGLAISVVKDGEVVRSQGLGLASVELDVPVTPATVFELASVTKQFTAAGIMRLVDEGKVRLGDEIGAYLPYRPDAWSGITVRHLLTHTAGLPGPGNAYRSLKPGMDWTTANQLAAAARDPLGFPPGGGYEYSDAGYFLLGVAIEKASGCSYRSFLADRFFTPLGMSATTVPDQWAIVKNRASGYTLAGGQLVRIRRDRQNELPSGTGVFSSVEDLVKWDAALSGGKVVPPASLVQMWTPVAQNDPTIVHPYGFGWKVEERFGRRMITHGGVTGTEYTKFPDDNLTVIVLTNLGNRGLDRVNPWGLTVDVAEFYLSAGGPVAAKGRRSRSGPDAQPLRAPASPGEPT
jgi:D-alanyl-D-alanine carboxypeptidase